jgi:formylglycine-generating enzyme required for sulfatase activity
MSELQPSTTDAILGGQNPPPPNAAVLGGVVGEKRKLANELGLNNELAYELIQTHDLFSFETVTIGRDKIAIHSKKQAFYYTEKLGNGITIDMVYIPAGSFMMGSDLESDEQPIHQVNLKSFYLAKYPTTQAQYMAVMGNNPSGFTEDDRHPVECVLWEDAIEFCQKLSNITGRKYTLPSESQWEYACRAGTTTQFSYGEVISMSLANYNGYTYKNPLAKTTPVGKYPANAWGLYDLHGNVCEWCLDNWHDDYRGAPTDGSAWIDESLKEHSFRGGSWYYLAKYCRSSWRYHKLVGSFHNNNDGFRLCSY